MVGERKLRRSSVEDIRISVDRSRHLVHWDVDREDRSLLQRLGDDVPLEQRRRDVRGHGRSSDGRADRCADGSADATVDARPDAGPDTRADAGADSRGYTGPDPCANAGADAGAHTSSDT